MRTRFRLAGVTLSLVVLSWPLAAQIERASLNGTVTDPSGAVIPGVQVQATSAQTGKQRLTTTNAEGIYTLPGLAVGTYSTDQLR